MKEAGLSVLFFPEASVIHHLGGSTRRVKPAMIASSHRSIYRYFKKHHPSSVNPFLGGLLLLTAMVRVCFEWLKP
jgi:GT2 family glycosyltransferase